VSCYKILLCDNTLILVNVRFLAAYQGSVTDKKGVPWNPLNSPDPPLYCISIIIIIIVLLTNKSVLKNLEFSTRVRTGVRTETSTETSWPGTETSWPSTEMVKKSTETRS